MNCFAMSKMASARIDVDHLSSLTSIIETRKLQNKDTFTAFVDFSKAYDRIDRSLLWEKLSGMGLRIKMLSAIKVLYRDVECCVCINGFKSPWFNVNTGLKQGCLLSPVLFYLFINDLVDEIKQSVKGVNIGDEWIVVLLYADDICILAENEADLQKALNIVHDRCTRWNMIVNTDKTQIVHFRTQSKERTGFMFIYGEQNINVMSQYKYMGLILNEHLDYFLMAKKVAKSAGQALGLLSAKCKGSGGMPYAVL